MNKPTLSSLKKEVEKFNKNNPVGTPVEYWKGFKGGEGKKSKTRSEAQILQGHSAVVWVENESGCISLSHVSILNTHA